MPTTTREPSAPPAPAPRAPAPRPATWGALARRAGPWLRGWALLRHAGAGLVAGTSVLCLALSLLPLATIVLLGRVLYLVPHSFGREAVAGAWEQLLLVLTLAIGALVAQQVVAPLQAGLLETIGRRVDRHCVGRVLRATTSHAPLSLLEDPDVLGILADARAAFDRQSRSPGEAAAAMLPLVGRYAQVVGASILVAVVVSPVAGVLLLGTALALRAGVRGGMSRFGAIWDGLTAQRRRTGYVRQLAITPDITKEVRVLGLLPWLRERLRTESLAQLRPEWAGRRRVFFLPFVGYGLLGLVGGSAVLAVVVLDAQDLDLFALGVALQAMMVPMRFGVHFPESDLQTQYGLQSLESLRRLEAHLVPGAPGTGEPAGTGGPGTSEALAHAPTGVVRFEDVWFRYSASSPWVLQGLDLTLEPGTSTAIVGLNGAGKTTTIKLLARLYTPTRGRITVGGVDLRTLPADRWQRCLSLIFQDYARFELSVTDNVTLAPTSQDDQGALDAALRAAGAHLVVDGLDDGLSTVLSGGYAKGRDLSGGQWQRVALARALFQIARGAQILVLDEPTAQLDVTAEAEFFERFLAPGAVDAVADGRPITSVVISHRFSTVRPADHIVVVEHGRVVEEGNHDELLAVGGRYAELFVLQARRFRADGDPPADGPVVGIPDVIDAGGFS